MSDTDNIYEDEDFASELPEDFEMDSNIFGPRVASIPITRVRMDKIRPNTWNPNVQKPETFNYLVADMGADDIGYDEPMHLVKMWGTVPPMPDDEAWKTFDWSQVRDQPSENDDPENPSWYRIVGGEHRWKGLRVLGFDEVDCVVRDDWDEVKQRIMTVRKNILRGSIDDEKFTAVVNYLISEESIDAEVLAQQMGFTHFNEFYKHYQEQQEQADKEIADLVDEAEKELGQVDSLSVVLNTIFRKFGDTLPADFLHFTWKRREHLMVLLDGRAKKATDLMVKYLKEINGFKLDSEENPKDRTAIPAGLDQASMLSINDFISSAIHNELKRRAEQADSLSEALGGNDGAKENQEEKQEETQEQKAQA